MDKISFGTRKIGTAKVLKLTDKGYMPYKADIAKFNILKLDDWNKVETLKDSWHCQLMDLLYERCMDFDFELNKKNVFFISEPQKYGKRAVFEPEKVLGVSLFIQYPLKYFNYLAILQKNPNYITQNRNDLFKHIGQEFLNFFKRNYGKKPIVVDSSAEAAGFYELSGLEYIEGTYSRYIWNVQ